MKTHILLFFALISVFKLNAQTKAPYSLDLKTDASLVGASFVLVGIDISLNKKISPLTEYDITNLSKTKINSFDKSATNNYSVNAALRSDVGLLGSFGIAALSTLAFSLENASENNSFASQASTLALMWFELNLINAMGTEIVKTSVKRTRPYAYNLEAPLEKKLELNTRKSFFSGHASISAANSFFVAKVFSDYYPDSKWRPIVWGIAALVPAWTGLERYNAGMHFPSDIITGYAFGALLAYFVPQLHKPTKQQTIAINKKMPSQFINYPALSFRLVF